MTISMDDILKANFGEASSEIRANFKKTVQIRSYETEVIDLETTLKVERALSGIERVLICALLQVQLEYEGYCQLAFKGLVTQGELNTRIKSLVEEAQALVDKAEKVYGIDIKSLFNAQ